MDQRRQDQTSTTRVEAILHGIKVWLNAPVMVPRRVGVKKVKAIYGTGTTSGEVSAAALVLHVCWLSILLGLVIQIALLVASQIFGHSPKLNPLIVDFAQRTAWSTIVCSSISVAMAASKLRESFIGLAGLLSGAVAFRIARAVQKGVGAALGVAPAAVNGPSPMVLGIIKAFEYGCLSAILAWMIKRKERGAATHAAIGLTTGVFFGSIALGYTYSTNIKLFTPADVASRGLNELLFPIGCSLVLFATEVWGKHWKSVATHTDQQATAERAESIS